MSQDKKPSTGELYARRQWSDNMSFSRKAMDESKKKTSQLDPEAVAETVAPVAPKKPDKDSSLEHYVHEMNSEINRMSDAVGDRLDNLGNKMSNSLDKVVKPLKSSVGHVTDNAGESLRNMRNHIGKAVLQEFTSVVKNISTKVARNNPPTPSSETPSAPSDSPASPATAPLPTAPLPEAATPKVERPPAPAYTWHFGKVLEQKIFFATIHNRSFLSERDVKEYDPEDAHKMHDWMERAVKEIKNCAPYGQKLPTPNKGLYEGIPMYDILRQATTRDVERFLGFVHHRPQPFQQKALKLSEAFATWAHKGAPEK